ncbi:MAG TPA: hypothetical protein VFA50_06535 [Stellaceae bacterium]|nr:hypothetical protein [Stellaceae bacterium]
MRYRTRLAAGLAAALAMVLAARGAAAQEDVLHSPEAIRSCLCMQEAITRQSTALGARQRSYDEKRRQLDALDAEVAAARPRVDIKSPASIDAFKQLLARRDAAAQTLAAEATPQYQALVERYNTRVADFNQNCASKSYDAAVLGQVRQSLACPAEQ